MVVCVSEDLQLLQEELSKRGYDVITSKSNDIRCDAIICNLKDGGLLKLNIQSSVRREGTLIIDCGSKNVDEIEYILNNRVYSTLF